MLLKNNAGNGYHPDTETTPLTNQNDMGGGGIFFGKRYTEMTTAERAAYRKSLIDDYTRVIGVTVDD